jgi:membrane fusion protein, multidrug efflux system
MRTLRQGQLVSAQEAEQAISDDDVARSKLESLAMQKGYEILRAPFDGTVTARFVDAGALVQNAANSQTSAQPVVTVSQINSLRIYIYIDQKDASYVSPGADVMITVTERPGFQLPAKVARVSGELDTKTRMLLTEIDVDNSKGELVPGSFVQVSLDVKTPIFLQVPVEALITQGDKYFVPIVSVDGIVTNREVKVADDDGKMVRLLSGVNENEMAALNLGNNVTSGSHVRAVPVETPAAPATAPVQTKTETAPAAPAPATKAAEPASEAQAAPSSPNPRIAAPPGGEKVETKGN